MNEFEEKLLNRLRSANERLNQIDTLDDREKLTARRVKLDLQPTVMSGEEIKRIRNFFQCSQAVFAMYIQVPSRTLQEWEQGRSAVPGPVCCLLGEMIRDPDYWKKRIAQIAIVTTD